MKLRMAISAIAPKAVPAIAPTPIPELLELELDFKTSVDWEEAAEVLVVEIDGMPVLEGVDEIDELSGLTRNTALTRHFPSACGSTADGQK